MRVGPTFMQVANKTTWKRPEEKYCQSTTLRLGGYHNRKFGKGPQMNEFLNNSCCFRYREEKLNKNAHIGLKKF